MLIGENDDVHECEWFCTLMWMVLYMNVSGSWTCGWWTLDEFEWDLFE